MKNLRELKENYESNEMKTVVVSKRNYDKLGKLGRFGDSYNTIIGRLLEKLEDED